MWYCCTFILILQKTGEIREVTEFWDSDEGSVSPDEGSVTPDKGSLCLTRTTFYLTRINPDLATDETQNLSDPYRILSDPCQTNPETDLEFWKEAERRKVGPEAI